MLYRLYLAYLTLFTLWPTYAGLKVSGLPILNIQRVYALLLIVLTIFSMLASPKNMTIAYRRFRESSRAVVFVSLFFLWRLISAVFSEDPIYSVFIAALDVLLQYSFFMMTILLVSSEKKIIESLKFVLYGAVIVSVIGVIESLIQANMFYNFVPRSAMETGYVASALTEKIRGTYRAQAGFLHPLVLAEYLILTIPVAILFLKVKVSKHIKLASVTVLLLGTYTLISTGSRAGVLIFILQLGLMFLFKLIRDLKNQREIMPIVRSFVMIAVVFTGIPVAYNFASIALERQSDSESMSTQARIDQFNLGLDTFEKHPLVGWGPGLAVDHVASSNVTTGEKSVDNYYLTIAADSGLPAFIFFVCVVVTYFRKARKLTAKLEPPYSNVSDGLSISLFGFLIFCAVLSTFEVFTLAYVYFALLTKLEVFQKNKGL